MATFLRTLPMVTLSYASMSTLYTVLVTCAVALTPSRSNITVTVSHSSTRSSRARSLYSCVCSSCTKDTLSDTSGTPMLWSLMYCSAAALSASAVGVSLNSAFKSSGSTPGVVVCAGRWGDLWARLHYAVAVAVIGIHPGVYVAAVLVLLEVGQVFAVAYRYAAVYAALLIQPHGVFIVFVFAAVTSSTVGSSERTDAGDFTIKSPEEVMSDQNVAG